MLVRFTVTLSTSKHLLYWQRHKLAPLEIASIAITRQSLLRSRLEYCSAARLPSRCHKEYYGLAVLKNAKSHQPASRYASRHPTHHLIIHLTGKEYGRKEGKLRVQKHVEQIRLPVEFSACVTLLI
jgi:hypothetical protein